MSLKKNKLILKNFIIKLNPGVKNKINIKEIDLIDDGIIDSFDIIQIIEKIEKMSGKKLNPENVKRESFSNLSNMLKLLK